MRIRGFEPAVDLGDIAKGTASEFIQDLKRYDRKLLFTTAHPLDLEATIAILELLWESNYTPVFENAYYAQLLDVMIDEIDYPMENELILAPRSTTGIGPLNNFEFEYLSMLRDRKIAIFFP